MIYRHIKEGFFESRPNRFIAIVKIDGISEICHVKNTGRCAELLIPGTKVYLEESENPNRKTKYDLIAVEKGEMLINMDSQAPNEVFSEFAKTFDPSTETVRREVSYGQSRLDFCLESGRGRHFVEIKGVTLEENGHAFFPDAPTERGIKHLHELMKIVRQGHRASAFFVLQMSPITDFAPNDRTHKAFGDALRDCQKTGVGLFAFTCKVTPNSIQIDKSVPIIL